MGAEEVTSSLISWERLGSVTSLLTLVGLLLIVATTVLGRFLVVVTFGVMEVKELLWQSGSKGNGWDKCSGESTSMVGILFSGRCIDVDNPMSIIPRVADSMINSLDIKAPEIRCCGWHSLSLVLSSLRETEVDE